MKKFLDILAHVVVISVFVGFIGGLAYAMIVAWPITLCLMVFAGIVWAFERVARLV